MTTKTNVDNVLTAECCQMSEDLKIKTFHYIRTKKNISHHGGATGKSCFTSTNPVLSNTKTQKIVTKTHQYFGLNSCHHGATEPQIRQSLDKVNVANVVKTGQKELIAQPQGNPTTTQTSHKKDMISFLYANTFLRNECPHWTRKRQLDKEWTKMSQTWMLGNTPNHTLLHLLYTGQQDISIYSYIL